MKNKFSLLYIVFSTLLFSCMEVAIKYSDNAFNPIQLNLIRFTVGGLMLLPLARKKLQQHNYVLSKSDYIKFAISGLMGVVVSLSFYNMCIAYIPAYKAAILFACNTYFSILFAFLFLKEHLSKLGFLAIFTAFTGMMIIIDPLSWQGSVTGIFLCCMAAITFALYGVTGKYFSKNLPIGGIVMTSYGFLFGVVELFILISLSHIKSISTFLLEHNFPTFASIPIFAGITSDNLPILLFISIGVTGIGFASYFLALENFPVAMVSLVFFIKPVLSPIIAFFILGEKISKQSLTGLSFIVLGSVLLFYSNIKKLKASF